MISVSLIDAQRSEVAGHFLVNFTTATVATTDIIQLPSTFVHQIVSVTFETYLKQSINNQLNYLIITKCAMKLLSRDYYLYEWNNVKNRLSISFKSPAFPPYSAGNKSFGMNLYRVSESGLWKWSWNKQTKKCTLLLISWFIHDYSLWVLVHQQQQLTVTLDLKCFFFGQKILASSSTLLFLMWNVLQINGITAFGMYSNELETGFMYGTHSRQIVKLLYSNVNLKFFFDSIVCVAKYMIFLFIYNTSLFWVFGKFPKLPNIQRIAANKFVMHVYGFVKNQTPKN